MRVRPGFSLLELIIVLALITSVSAILMPSMGRSLAQVRLQRAATIVASNLQYAHSVAARQRSPVRLSIDPARKVIRVRDYVNGRVFSEHRFDGTAENSVGRMEGDTTLVIYPNGLVATEFEVSLITADKRRVISMTRAGQIRIEQ
jgi:prepilin-type N-terminal cleavage/methylation domain-containing protein